MPVESSITAPVVTSTAGIIGAAISYQFSFGLFAASLCGAIIFMAWSTEPSIPKKVVYLIVGTALGYIFGPILAGEPSTPNIASEVYALGISALGVTVVNKVITFVSENTVFQMIEKIRGARK